MTDDMVERVARGICKSVCSVCGDNSVCLYPLSYETEARAAIAAMPPSVREKELIETIEGLIHGLPELLESIGYADEENLIDKARAAMAAMPPSAREANHCADCCCARCWKALGITKYSGKSIPEHITELVKALRACSVRFREYEASHATKGHERGAAKAQRNADMADMCDDVLAKESTFILKDCTIETSADG